MLIGAINGFVSIGEPVIGAEVFIVGSTTIELAPNRSPAMVIFGWLACYIVVVFSQAGMVNC